MQRITATTSLSAMLLYFLLLLFLLLSSLFLASCQPSAEERAQTFIESNYINGQQGKLSLSNSYKEEGDRAAVIALFCDTGKKGTLPRAQLLKIFFKKQDGWQVSRGPDPYTLRAYSSGAIKRAARDLLSRAPSACKKESSFQLGGNLAG